MTTLQVRVKNEELEEQHHAFQADTDSEVEAIEIDKLQPLEPKFASSSKFPVGCMVWYDTRKPLPMIVRAKSASVVGVYIHVENLRRVYRLKAETPTKDEIIMYEHQLFYAVSCPVRVVQRDNTYEAADGIIIFPSIERGEDGRTKVTYAVQYWEEGGYVAVENGVTADRIKYRGDSEIKTRAKNESGQRDKEKSRGVSEQFAEIDKTEVEDEAREDRPQTRSATAEPNTCREIALVSIEQHQDSAERGKVGISTKSSGQQQTATANEDIGDDNRDDNTSADTTNHTRNEAQTLSSLQVDRYDEIYRSKSLVTNNRWEPPKRSAGSEAIQRPHKLVKTERDGSCGMLNDDVTCELFIPSWMPRVKQMHGQKSINLFHHLIGVGGEGRKPGYKTKRISSTTRCKVHISPPEEKQMKIKFVSDSAENVEKAICMVEESLLEFLSDEHAEKRLLYDLAASALGSYNIQREQTSCGLFLKRFNEGKSWWRMFELPCNVRGEYHGRKSLYNLKLPANCKIELFGDMFGKSLKHTSPYVLISGNELDDAKAGVSMTVDAMKNHQKMCADCQPAW